MSSKTAARPADPTRGCHQDHRLGGSDAAANDASETQTSREKPACGITSKELRRLLRACEPDGLGRKSCAPRGLRVSGDGPAPASHVMTAGSILAFHQCHANQDLAHRYRGHGIGRRSRRFGVSRGLDHCADRDSRAGRSAAFGNYSPDAGRTRATGVLFLSRFWLQSTTQVHA